MLSKHSVIIHTILILLLCQLLLVFTNCIEFNKDNPVIVEKCQLLVKYIRWLALEHLPLKDDKDAANPSLLGELRESVRDREREERMSLVASTEIDPKACSKFLKIFEQRKCRREYEYFAR